MAFAEGSGMGSPRYGSRRDYATRSLPVSSAKSSEAAVLAIGAGPTRRGDQLGMRLAVGTTMPNRSEIPARLAA
jgi:hypothetical protein